MVCIRCRVDRVLRRSFRCCLAAPTSGCFPNRLGESPAEPAFMLIHLTLRLAPAVELAGGNVEPPDETPIADLFLVRHAPPSVQPRLHLLSGFSVSEFVRAQVARWSVLIFWEATTFSPKNSFRCLLEGLDVGAVATR